MASTGWIRRPRIVGEMHAATPTRPAPAIVIPMVPGRDGDRLLLHGAPAAGIFRHARGADVCVTMTLVPSMSWLTWLMRWLMPPVPIKK